MESNLEEAKCALERARDKTEDEGERDAIFNAICIVDDVIAGAYKTESDES